MSFYSYNQNNSGGSFTFEPTRGISHHVVIEAESADQANKIAEGIGLYFDGENDCPCCGSRWYEAYGEGDPEPLVYGEPVERFSPSFGKYINGPEVFVHYLNGEVKGYCY